MCTSRLIFQDDFSSRSEGDSMAELFFLEGDVGGKVSIVRGGMELVSGTGGYEASNLWLRQMLPPDIRVEFSFQALTHRTNMVFVFPAMYGEGVDLLDGGVHRNGHYACLTNAPGWWEYQPEALRNCLVPPIYAYTFSLFEPLEWRIPVRKNPGWICLGTTDRLPEKPTDFPPQGEPHHYQAECFHGRIRIRRDDELLVDVADPGGQLVEATTRHHDGRLEKKPVTLPVYRHPGYLGIRTHRVHARFEYLRIYALE